MILDSLRARSYVKQHRERLYEIISDLVRIPSENKPPLGDEAACQQYIEKLLSGLGMEAVSYRPDSVASVREHPLFWPGRDYSNRNNLIATRKGGGGGKSLLLSGHIDTVPAGTLPWTRSPFSGFIEGGRLYGRGSNDMKGGVGTSLFVLESLQRSGIELRGDLFFESVVDEEFGGCNGTLAGRVAGYSADAAIITEPSWLRVCPAQRGGRTVHITLRASGGGVLTDGKFPGGVAASLRCFLDALPEFERRRRKSAPHHAAYAASPDPVPVSITKISTGPWGTGEPMGIPEQCRIEMYWQSMPGETREAVEQEFSDWFRGLVDSNPNLFQMRPMVEFPIRWLPGSALALDHPLVTGFGEVARQMSGRAVPVEGIEGPCDLFLFQEFGIPAILWGPIGGNTHAADEYVDLESVEAAAATLLSFVCQWCDSGDGTLID